MKNVVSLCWTLVLVFVSFCVQSCDESAPTIPASPSADVGSLRILVEDPSSSFSYIVEVDGRSYGVWPAPCVIPNVAVGVHQIVVFNEVWSSPVTEVNIMAESETRVSVSLLAIRPYVDNVAPGFSASSIDGQTLTLKALRGKVVVLAFFGTVG